MRRKTTSRDFFKGLELGPDGVVIQVNFQGAQGTSGEVVALAELELVNTAALLRSWLLVCTLHVPEATSHHTPSFLVVHVVHRTLHWAGIRSICLS